MFKNRFGWLLAMLLLLSGCANAIGPATRTANVGAAALTTAHSQLTQSRQRAQLAAAASVLGDRADPAVQAAQLAAAAEVGVRYRPAWTAYSATRFAWLRLVGAIQLAQANPELIDPVSLIGFATALVAAQADLSAYAADAMRQVLDWHDTPPPAAPEVKP